MGLVRLIDELTRNGSKYYYATFLGSVHIDTAQNSVIKLLLLTPQSFRRLREYNGGRDMLVWLQFESLTRKEIPIETLDWLIRNRIEPDTFNFINTRMSVAQIVRYIQRQMEESGMNLRETLTT